MTSKKFIRATSGWIPVSVLLLLAFALVMGKAGANQPEGLLSAVPAPEKIELKFGTGMITGASAAPVTGMQDR